VRLGDRHACDAAWRPDKLGEDRHQREGGRL